LNKKFYAIAITILMILGTFAVAVPSAKAGTDVRQAPLCNDDPTVTPICVFLHPGIEDAYKPGWSHTLDTLWGTQDGTTQNRQVFDHYLDYSILASGSDSIGDLQFDIQVVAAHIHRIEIFVPPEFTWLGPTKEESVWTDITNDYNYIYVSAQSSYSPDAPGWNRLRIGRDLDYGWSNNALTIYSGIYHIRLFNLRAPETAGLYFFKIKVNGASIGVGNYPFLVVKSELNPAYAQVTVKAAFNFPAPYVSGKVTAEGTTPEGRAVKGMAYWGPYDYIGQDEDATNPGALYSVVLFGLAAGTYTITAEASGYDPSSSPGGTRITLAPGQSMHGIFILLYTSPVVRVTVFSKHGTGEIPWNNLWQFPYGTNDPSAPPDDNALGGEGTRAWRDILLELYDSGSNLIGFWFSDVHGIKGPYTGYSNVLLGLHDDEAPHPESTSYFAELVDNYDVFGTHRHLSSTHWDGHVPFDTADYVAGMPKGQYTVEGFVTGYIMDEADAYQRAFTITGSNYQLQFDLRRSNWIEISMHMPAVPLSYDTTVTLTAVDGSGAERGAVAFFATAAMSADQILDGADLTDGVYTGGIVIEGFNAIFPYAMTYGTDPARKDYGLNPTAATHSAGTVSMGGNPYTVKLYMSDMGIPFEGVKGTGWYNIVGGDPQASIFLCNSPVSLSFSIVSAWLWISLRSVDFEVPAHSRPWTFPGAEIWVEFVDTATGKPVEWVDAWLYGIVQDPDGVTPYDIDNVNDPGLHEHLGVYFYGQDFSNDVSPNWSLGLWFPLNDMYRSTRLPAGEYTYNVYTHGYIMRRSFPVQVPFSGGADIEADLIQGAQIRVEMDFLHEAVATNFNGFVRVEVFNSNNELVGASIYGQAQPNVYTRVGSGGAYLQYVPDMDWTVGSLEGFTQSGAKEPAQGTGFGLTANLAGWMEPSSSYAQRAFVSHELYGEPLTTWATFVTLNPADANRLQVPAGWTAGFDVYGFYDYFGAAARTWAGGWPTTNGRKGTNSAWNYQWWDSGLKGSNDIPGWAGSGGGLYTVKIWAFDSMGPNGEFEDGMPSDDWRMYQMGWELTNVEVPWGGSVKLFMDMNNMASLRGTVRWFDMYGNLRPLPWAQISASPGSAFDSVPAYSSGLGAVGAGASDSAGSYIMWLPAGSHDVSIGTSEAPQVWGSSAPTSNAEYTVVVSNGWVGGGDTQLSGSGTPVPELPSFIAPLSLFAALAASVWLLRKRTLNAPVLMK
jgi:hypothetical protein